MDRRTFNKTMGALFGALVVPGVPKVLAVPSTEAAKAAAVGHWGLTSLNATTTFNLEQVFEHGQLGIWENPEETPEVDINASFWLDENRKVERTIYFNGQNKEWNYEQQENGNSKVEAREGIIHQPVQAVMDTRKPKRNVSPVTGRTSDDIGTGRIYYVATDFIVYPAGDYGNPEWRIPLDKIEKDKHYDLEVVVMDTDPQNKDAVCTLVMHNFKVTHFEDFDYNENDFQS